MRPGASIALGVAAILVGATVLVTVGMAAQDTVVTVAGWFQ